MQTHSPNSKVAARVWLKRWMKKLQIEENRGWRDVYDREKYERIEEKRDEAKKARGIKIKKNQETTEKVDKRVRG